jgi:hypothetical protein
VASMAGPVVRGPSKPYRRARAADRRLVALLLRRSTRWVLLIVLIDHGDREHTSVGDLTQPLAPFPGCLQRNRCRCDQVAIASSRISADHPGLRERDLSVIKQSHEVLARDVQQIRRLLRRDLLLGRNHSDRIAAGEDLGHSSKYVPSPQRAVRLVTQNAGGPFPARGQASRHMARSERGVAAETGAMRVPRVILKVWPRHSMLRLAQARIQQKSAT